MKQFINLLIVVTLSLVIITGCNSKTPDTENKKDSVVAGTTTENQNTVLAKYVSSIIFEGDAVLTFEKSDGTKIEFCHNFMNPELPKLDVQFFAEDGLNPNPATLGKTFEISYKVNPVGKSDMQTGAQTPCNQIIKITQK